MSRSLRLLPLLLAGLVLAACGAEDADRAGGGAEPGGRLQVVATTTQVADLARNVAGDRAEVRGLLTANADPHEYEVRPSDVDGLAEADLVLRSGGDLDEWLGEAIETSGGDPEVVTLIDSVEPLAGEGETDPHWWQDPRNAMTAVTTIRDALTRADPGGARAYRARADDYLAELRALDASVAACLRSVPAGQRKLVTTHDALGYYARRYGIRVIGAVIPSRSTSAQPSAGQTAALVDTIRAQGVRAVFAESSVRADVEAAIARDAGAKVGRPLYADTLGEKGSGAETYLGSIRANTDALVEGFTGGARRCTP